MGEMTLMEIWTELLGTVIPKLYALYLLIVFSVAVARNYQLETRLWSFKKKKKKLWVLVYPIILDQLLTQLLKGK